jgi:hypothetical protein
LVMSLRSREIFSFSCLSFLYLGSSTFTATPGTGRGRGCSHDVLPLRSDPARAQARPHFKAAFSVVTSIPGTGNNTLHWLSTYCVPTQGSLDLHIRYSSDITNAI